MMLGSLVEGFQQAQEAAQRRRAMDEQNQKSLIELQQLRRQQAALAAAFGRGGVTGLPGSQTMPQPMPGMSRGMIPSAMDWLGRQFGGGASGSPPTGGGPPMGGGGPPGGGMPRTVGNASNDDFSLTGMDRQVQQIASEIKARNPGIADDVLAEAVSERLALLSKVGALSSPMERYYAALLASGDRRRGQDLRAKEVDERVATQKYSAELASQWHLAGQNLSHADRQATIAAGLERAQYVQDQLNDRFSKGLISKQQWQEGNVRAANIRNQMNAAQRRMNAIINANPDADPSQNPQYKAASDDYEAAAAKLDATDQGMERMSSPVDKSPGNQASDTPKPAAKPGASRDNPVKPASLAEARKLPKGTWIQDPTGKIAQTP